MKTLFLASLLAAGMVSPVFADTNDTTPVDLPIIRSNADAFVATPVDTSSADVTLLFGDADSMGTLPQSSDYIEMQLDKPAPDEE